MIKTLAVAVLLAGTTAATAGTLTTLYDTGVDVNGVATTGHAADLHWTVDGGAAYTGATNGQFPIPPWIAETSTSRWITPTANATDTYDFADHVYTYTETFTLTASQAAHARFSGRFASDNLVDSIKVNGTTVPGSGPVGGAGFTAYQPFSSDGVALVAGANTLTFAVRNIAATTQNPTGLRVEVAGTVPEASTWAMLLAGFGLVGVATRRRSAIVAA